MTAHDNLLTAVDDIDKIFGEGTAKKRPDLIAVYMQAASFDLLTSTLAQQLRAGLDDIAEAIDRMEARD